MPTSSQSRKQSRVGASETGSNTRRTYWPNANENRTTKINIRRASPAHQDHPYTDSPVARGGATIIKSKESKLIRKPNSKTSGNKLATLAAKYNKIAHISPPTSLTSTSVALRNSVMVGGGGANERPAKGLGKGGLAAAVAAAGISHRLEGPSSGSNLEHSVDIESHQPVSLTDFSPPAGRGHINLAAGQKQSGGQFAFLGGKSFLVNGVSQQFVQHNNSSMSPKQQSQSQGSLAISPTPGGSSSLANSNNSSTAQLQMMGSNSANQRQLHIGRRMDLKYVKSFLIILMAADLLITVFIHQFATNDELNLSLAWLRSIKLRLSLINLVLSSIWFVILIGGILFDIYYILFVSVLIDLASFLLLLGLSVVHFTRRIDYNTVQLTSLLALLFSIVVLHVYTLVMAALTLYLMLAVRRRQRSRPNNSG